MPSPKMIFWVVGLSLATTLALEHFRTKGAPAAVRKVV
ncbi:MAG: hypothetical protein JWP02_1498 [Acidimicrobiales bacterium]|nr:hypothetical protein [Acidimicrobiales bacterium]